MLTLGAFLGMLLFGFFAMPLAAKFVLNSPATPLGTDDFYELVGLAVLMNGLFIWVITSYLIWRELGLDD